MESGDTDGDAVAVPVIVPDGVTAIAIQIKEYELPAPEVSVTEIK
jgi:hypothetical protein